MNIHNDSVPLRPDEHGILRVGDTRVLYTLVIHAFDNGATPEEIVRMYDTLNLPDVYAVIAYYLNHQDEVRVYLQEREVAAQKVRAMIEANQPSSQEIRARLEARRAAMEKRHAETGQ